MDLAEIQISTLHEFMAQHQRPAGVSVSEHVQRAAAAGNAIARRVLATGLFNNATAGAAPQAPAPIVTPAMAERERRIATQVLPARMDRPDPARAVVHSEATPAWAK
jgi:hypothetical protein